MSIVPTTFDDISEFIIQQERVLTRSIKYDLPLQKDLLQNGVTLNDEQIDNLLYKVNMEMKKKYKNTLFLRQNRFQVIQQIMQYERDLKESKMKKIDDIHSLIRIFMDKIESMNEMDLEDDSTNLLDENMLLIIKDLPDSNLLGTNDIELIDNYDRIRHELSKNIRKMHKTRKDIKQIIDIKERAEEVVSTCIKIDERTEKYQLQNKINEEMKRTRYLLSMLQNK